MTQELTLFKDKKLRIEMQEGEPYFCLKDICDGIGVQDTGNVLQKLRSTGVYKVHPGIMATINTPTETGMRAMAYVTEEGLYEIVMGSRKPKAKELHRMVIQALPGLRKQPDTAAIIQGLEDRLAALERGGNHLLLQPIPEISLRSQINMIIRKFVARQNSGYSYEDAWNELYYQFKYRFHKDLKAVARKRSCDVLDFAEKDGLMGDLCNLAAHIFAEAR
ncbi:Bro-N domain-containing protein [Candidatus Pacearchaeota archaeon]|jgi:prophage antirepressor-like protein|nr:Bro-N domain-containing protein [Candidatus Pacearchaeota archaeon]